ncbi:MAG TPA: exonuclease domain-containing protein [Bacteroidia bacterium]|nr:exonuclease domain-containing protein [Bacteroidia bacterium]
MYAIVDIETTGGFAQGHRITEIAIAVYDGNEVVEWYETLVNPGMFIPQYITALTGIDNEMVENAPSFADIAPKIYSLLEPCVFVAHNVNFDYSFVKNELAGAGIEWNAKKLCTVRLSRKIFPGWESYNLSSICTSLNIEQKIKHRAGADTLATVEVFRKLQSNDTLNVIKDSLKRNASEFRLPANLNREEFNAVPSTAGVYFFHNEKNEVIYVGKANNLKKRVGQHFSGKITQETRQGFLKEIYHISYEECGNELVALLLEEQEIKRHWPKYNRASKKIKFALGLFDYTDRRGHIRLGIDYIRRGAMPLMRFATMAEARHFLLSKTDEYALCPKLCAIDTSETDTCNTVLYKHCTGNCRNVDAVETYNEKVQRFIDELGDYKPSYALLSKGRKDDEYAVVYVNQGTFKGYGFIEKSLAFNSREELEDYIKPCKATIDAEMILNSYLRRNPYTKMVVFN